ncbi:galactose 1-dehydrogenase [Sphingomonas sp. PP-CE-3A-406]|uniref:Gfo/Idh/MocA family protein n=1 Tax=Sphingomonas sp. PP-CE-3A-406 TaxID=2135659 RepID=UPI000EF9E90F|nr:Gfo/Idh/MocA family oxidoreductase [Sphingomonas sp. PP-CE-3A-406]RMB52173.1 galactose 1-dehydrogenase [Sphingomonas sp. PP-CE-3A-406]
MAADLSSLKPIRLAIVGIGKIARDQHLPAIAQDPRFELVAAVSRNAVVDGVPNYHDIAELVAAGHNLDAVSLCTPPVGRAEIAMAAIDAGLDVMMEKPPAATLSEVARIEAHAVAAGRTLFATWHSREAAGVAPARQWLEGRRVERVTIDWREDIRRWHPGQDWILEAGGFGVFDPGINALSIATEILPGGWTVDDAEMHVPEGRMSPLAADLRLSCDGLVGARVPVTAAFDFLHEGPQQWDIVVDTDGGRLTLRMGGSVLEVDGQVSEAPDAEYARLYGKFADLVRARSSAVDVTPLRLVADAFLVGRRTIVPAFAW